MSKLILALLSLSATLLLLALVSFNSRPTFLENSPKPPIKIHALEHAQLAASHCEGTLYPEQCVTTVSAALPQLRRKTLPEVISATVNATVREVHASADNCSSIRRKLLRRLDARELHALDDCLELFSDTVAELNHILAELSSPSASPEDYYDDLQTLLSGAMTNQATCLDGFAYSVNNTRRLIEGRLKRITRHVSNALAMVRKLKRKSSKRKPKIPAAHGEFPAWLRRSDRRLLQAATNRTAPNLVVAKDGSGNFTTIGEALAAAPNNSDARIVIYIKTGAYYEYIEVDRRKRNIMFLGDGIGKTLIKGNRSVVDGWTTFRSATVAVVGNGFIAKGITFENYAGPAKHQAVALRSSADFSVFYQCSFVAYQDTLYVHSLRQFYRECDVYGTVDFIFGNAAVMEEVVHPRGWLEWDGDFALDTLYYGEYRNRGPGANTSARVTWPGYRVINSSQEAGQFTVDNFIQGSEWLPATSVPFYPNLTAT
ncbi:Probable pectinesterase/pectinesterase inhibitor 40 [Striga hermonthica]|uniref:Pectinesterase n=1 Tax=Striga hermonthica TaxID=68872 RepID=A0A9N7NE24_STRHE|nr:Probable pectinesterase/pectinesterase inhibitor 40 [Striga hermonthica]